MNTICFYSNDGQNFGRKLILFFFKMLWFWFCKYIKNRWLQWFNFSIFFWIDLILEKPRKHDLALPQYQISFLCKTNSIEPIFKTSLSTQPNLPQKVAWYPFNFLKLSDRTSVSQTLRKPFSEIWNWKAHLKYKIGTFQ